MEQDSLFKSTFVQERCINPFGYPFFIVLLRIVNQKLQIMDFKDILAISGQSGLFKFVAQSRNGIIVESLANGTRSCASASARVSALSEIAIFTEGEDMPLAKVFQSIYEKQEGKEAISPKSAPEELKRFFAGVLPEYDRDRVHVSDIKKVVAWYNLLIAAGVTRFETKEEEGPKEESQEEK